MPASLELFFEIKGSVFVQSVEQPNQINNPVFYADDVKPILLKLVSRISATTVEVVDLTGITVQMALGTPAAVPTVFTSATSSTVDGNGFLPISLPLNVAAVQTALGTNLSINPTLEFRIVSGATPERYQTSCTLKQRLITGTLADPDAPAIATSLAEVMSLMVPRDGSNTSYPCSSFIMLDVNDATKLYQVVVENGELHAQPLQ